MDTCGDCGHDHAHHVMGGECQVSGCECLNFWDDEEDEGL